MKNKITAFISVVKYECHCILLNPRIITVGMLYVFIYNYVITELLGKAAKTGIPINLSEVFVALCNSGFLIMLVPGVFLILISDFPNMGAYTLYVLPRSGRMPWFWAKVVSSICCILVYVGTLYFYCILTALPGGKFSTSWSDTVTKYKAMFPGEEGGLMAELLSSSLYNHFSFMEVFFHSLILLILYLFSISLILIFFRVLYMKTAGIAAAFAMVGGGIVTMSLNTGLKWFFPLSHVILWNHYQEALRKPIMPLWASYLYFGVLIAIILSADIIAVKRTNIYLEDG